jgi:uncharacterized protein YjbI with pentapeptide repeats
MKVFKPLQASLLHKTFEFKGKKQLAVSVLFGFPFDGSEPMLEPNLWKFIASEIGKNGILDLGMPKPNGEVLLHGKYFAPKGTSVTADSVRLKLGKIEKVLLVYGNRYWRVMLGPTEPEPIREMPLDYSNAFGGKGYAKNPIGKGMVDVDVFGEMRRPLPNVEYPDQVMSSSGQKPDPAGFGPLDMAWEFRTSKLGTYDDKWLRERWPAYPDDLNWNHFNAAPHDQWLDEYFSGTETFDLYNMHPDKPVVRGQLPPFRTRCFIKRASSGDGEIDEIKMRAETVWLFPHAETGIVLYRGVIGIQTDDVSDVKNIIIGYENLTDPLRDTSHYANALTSRQVGEKMLNTTDLIPNGATCGFGAVEEPESSSGSDNSGGSGDGGGGKSMGSTKTPAESKRAALIALSDKLAEIPGTDAARAKVGEEIMETYLPPLFPRPSEHARILNEYISEKNRMEELRVDIRRLGGNVSEIPDIDIEQSRVKLEEAARDMKECYRAQAHMLDEGRPSHEEHLKALREDLLKRFKSGEKLAGWDLAGVDLSKQDLSGIDFSGCYLEGVDFTDCKLIGANLERAILAFANLSSCDLSGANLKRANLGAANLTHAVFDGADLTETILARSLLTRAKLTNCNMTDVDMFEAGLGEADLSGSILPHTHFIDLHIARAKFIKTVLTGSTFSNCNLEDTDFSESVLDESTWIASWLDRANFSNARMTNSRFPGSSSLRDAKFVRAVLNSSNFRETDLSSVDFTEATLDMCDFSDSKARKARFTRATAKKAQFIGTDLSEADLSSMNLMEGTLMKARLTSATLRNANCYGVEFMNATVGKTDFSGAILYQTKLEHWRPS